MDAGDVIVIDEYRGMCWGGGCEGEGALQIMFGRWVMDVDGVGGEVRADGDWRVDVGGDLSSVQRHLVIVADSRGCRVSRQGSGGLSLTSKMLGKGKAGVVTKRKIMGPTAVPLDGVAVRRPWFARVLVFYYWIAVVESGGLVVE